MLTTSSCASCRSRISSAGSLRSAGLPLAARPRPPPAAPPRAAGAADRPVPAGTTFLVGTDILAATPLALLPFSRMLGAPNALMSTSRATSPGARPPELLSYSKH